jgi:PD-(D/E)XK nuclease superfamily
MSELNLPVLGKERSFMPLDSSLNLTGDPRFLKVSASDVSGSCVCGRFLALKTRPGVKAVDGWQRLYAPWDERIPFPLGDVVELVRDADGRDFATYEEQAAWLADAIDRLKVHRLLRAYVSLAVDNILDAHESITAEVGGLRLLPGEPWTGTATRKLAAWAPLYETNDQVREIRRFRLGSARADEDSKRWSVIAAFVAANSRLADPPRRVRVVEIGAVDGSVAVLFNDTADKARSDFAESGRSLAVAAAEEDHVVPCRSCGECKAAGSCRSLISVDGMLGQAKRGHSSRSISPRDLEQYGTCPAQWLLDSCLHLPSESGGGNGAARGLAVHRWLQAAHSRGVPCTRADLPVPGSGLGLADGRLTEAEYETAYPFLLQHAGQCPLADGTLILADDNVYGYDHNAEVVPVIRPDLLYRDGERLVIREFKTAEQPYESGKADAYEKHLQIPFDITMLNAGLIRHYGAASGTVEVELLTTAGRSVWTWDAGDPAVAAVAAGTVGRAIADWHEDNTWTTRPGLHCTWCPVRRWCPDSDVWQSRAPTTAVLAPAPPAADDDEPPF